MTPAASAFDDAMIERAAREIVSVIRTDETVTEVIAALLTSTGRLVRPGGSVSCDTFRLLFARSMDVFAAALQDATGLALLEMLTSDKRRTLLIREFFLEPKDFYSFDDLADLWCVPVESVQDVFYDWIAQCDLDLGSGVAGTTRVGWPLAVVTTVTFSLLRPADIERALGAQFGLVRGTRWATVPVLIRIPRFVATAFALDQSLPSSLALAKRIEQVLLEFVSAEYVEGAPL
jgi:hypothetical protein